MDRSFATDDQDILSFEDMRPGEQAIIEALEAANAAGLESMQTVEIREFNKWDRVEKHDCDGDCPVCHDVIRSGFNRVQNNIPRLLQYGWIERVSRGVYALVPAETESQAEPLFLISDPPSLPEPVETFPDGTVTDFVPLNLCKPNPRETSQGEAYLLRSAYENEAFDVVDSIKKTDCTFYGACLNQAISGKWEGFSCTQCKAYSAPSQFKKELDLVALLAAHAVAEMVAIDGKPHRVRGAKPGCDKIPVLEDGY